MTSKPQLKRGPASAYEGANQIIREFSGGTNGNGGLLAIRAMEDGTLRLEAYRLSGTVVTVGSTDDDGRGQPSLAQGQIADWLTYRAAETADDGDRELLMSVVRCLRHDERCVMHWTHEGECSIPGGEQ